MTGWPHSGTGITITWDEDHCQTTEPGGPGTGVVAPAGYFYVAAYNPDVLRIRPHQGTQIASVTDCRGVVSLVESESQPHDPSQLGYATFSAGASSAGYAPCGYQPIAVEPTTWSRIKVMFR
jgi:hypothetical protein